MLYFLVLAILAIAACSKSDDKPEENKFDQSTLLVNFADNLIVPSYEKLATESDLLLNAATAFSASADLSTLKALQTRFRSAYKAWLRCEPFNFGPADNVIKLQNSVNYWPIRTSFVDAELSASNALTDTYINSLGSEKKGFPAMAYLIFKLEDNDAVLQRFTTASTAARGKEYLVAMAQNIKTNIAGVVTEWKSAYAAAFKSNTGTELNSSLSLLLNNLVIALETSKNKRIGIPIGRKDNFTQGAADPNSLELPTTTFAKEMQIESAQVLSDFFEGRHDGTDGIGFDDYLAALKINDNGVALEQSIETELAAFISAGEGISSPMQSAVVSNVAPIDAVWVQSKKLLVLLKVDMASNLGILITFSDSDGD